MGTLVLVRHGQSKWNFENRFTGIMDIELTDEGRKEARITGQKLRNIHFDAAFTSLLKRAWETLDIILDEIKQKNVPIYKTAALNERCYGALQGLRKDEVERQYGPELVNKWRRSYDVSPPGGESLKETKERVLPYYKHHIEPLLKEGKIILIVAHGNSLRALLMYIEHISEDKIQELELRTGVPRIYDFREKYHQSLTV